jgi:hypothetical protein
VKGVSTDEVLDKPHSQGIPSSKSSWSFISFDFVLFLPSSLL